MVLHVNTQFVETNLVLAAVTYFLKSLFTEVEDFARRLNSDWPERMQEILSLGQERRPVPFSINRNSSVRRYACYKCFTCFSLQIAFEPNDMPCSLRPRVEGEC
ncbi:hypothetical protein FF1_000672 [Malus domestica]